MPAKSTRDASSDRLADGMSSDTFSEYTADVRPDGNAGGVSTTTAVPAVTVSELVSDSASSATSPNVTTSPLCSRRPAGLSIVNDTSDGAVGSTSTWSRRLGYTTAELPAASTRSISRLSTPWASLRTMVVRYCAPLMPPSGWGTDALMVSERLRGAPSFADAITTGFVKFTNSTSSSFATYTCLFSTTGGAYDGGTAS